MTESTIYFRDNFFSAGVTEIFNGNKVKVGSLDLKSAFTSKVDVLDSKENVTVKGYFPVLGFSWIIADGEGSEIGKLRNRLSFFVKKYEYQANGRGVYQIESEPFSKEYKIMDANNDVIAEFRRLSNFFESPAYQLINYSNILKDDEIVGVVMGVNMLQKRKRRSNSNSAT